MLKKKILSFIGVMLVAAGLTVAIAAPAQAAYTDCSITQAACMFWDTNGNSFRWDIPYSYGCKNMSPTWNDQASSLRLNSIAHGINTGVLLQWWQDGNCSGQSQYWAPSASPHNGNFSSPWNDEVSSYAIYVCQVDIRC